MPEAPNHEAARGKMELLRELKDYFSSVNISNKSCKSLIWILSIRHLMAVLRGLIICGAFLDVQNLYVYIVCHEMRLCHIDIVTLLL